MSFLRSRFFQAVLILVVAFCLLRFGIRPPAPWSVLTIYMTIVFLAVMVYVSSDADSWRSFVRPMWSTLVDGQALRSARSMIVLPLPLGHAYSQAAAKPRAPAGCAPSTPRRRERPVPGDQHLRRENPLGTREVQYVAKGAEIYIRNCMYCHSDNLDGRGHFAKGSTRHPRTSRIRDDRHAPGAYLF
jgi:hypothetical protein